MDFSERFWRLICEYRPWLLWLLAAETTFAVLLLLSLPALEPGSAAATVAVLDAGILVVGTGSIGAVLWQCRRRRRRHEPDTFEDGRAT